MQGVRWRGLSRCKQSADDILWLTQNHSKRDDRVRASELRHLDDFGLGQPTDSGTQYDLSPEHRGRRIDYKRRTPLEPDRVRAGLFSWHLNLKAPAEH